MRKKSTAYLQGYKAARSGRFLSSNPYINGSPAFWEWRDGFLNFGKVKS